MRTFKEHMKKSKRAPRRKTQVISFRCVLKNALGQWIGSSFSQEVLRAEHPVSGPQEILIRALHELKKGEKKNVFLPAPQAYGFYRRELVVEVSRKRLPKGLTPQLGSEFWGHSPEGDARLFRVTDVTMNSITLDGNHPLAGQDLIMEVEATDIREATAEEAKAVERAGEHSFSMPEFPSLLVH